MLVKDLVAAASTTTAATGASAASAAAVRATETAIAAAAGRTAATTAAVSTTTTAAASTTAVAATAATKAASAWRTSLHRTRFVNDDATAAQWLTIHAIDGSLRFRIAGHFDKTKALGATRVALHHDFSTGNSAELTKRLLQIFVTHRVRQVADV